ncbi:MAG: quinolinate synthase NadA [Rikenellaceae bacterium]
MGVISKIKQLKESRNAVILAHYYTTAEIQDNADFVGDSLALSQKAATTDADVILFAGVDFMAETAKILSPEKTVLIPDLESGCSLADSCPSDSFGEFVALHPDHTVISYVNTTAAVKALSDIIVTSSNAVEIVGSLDADTKIIFGPDRNLGSYVASQTGREMLIWDGACHVHQQFSLERILELKKEFPSAKILAHPECTRPVLLVADVVGSTAALLNYTLSDDTQEYIVATESGIIHQMSSASPSKRFIAAPPLDSSCGCNDCSFMKLNTLEKVASALETLSPSIELDETLRQRAELPIRRMLDISKELGLI